MRVRGPGTRTRALAALDSLARRAAPSRGARAAGRPPGGAVRWLALLALSGLPGALAAQGEWPTLAGMGVEYISPSGDVQVSFSGQLDVEGIWVSNSWSSLVSLEEGNDVLFSVPEDCSECHSEGDVPLASSEGGLGAHRLRLFTDIFLGDHVYSLVQFQTDRGSSPTDGKVKARVEQAYVRVANQRGTWGVQTGRFASPVGSYPLRHLSVVDPFLRPPLAYDYRTLMNRTVIPADETALLGWRDTPESFRRGGVPPIWDVPYQWGGMAFGNLLGIDLRAAAMNSAPSSAPDAWAFDMDRLEDPSWVVAARARPSIDWEVGASWSKGPWMEEAPVDSTAPTPPPGSRPADIRAYDQEILTADVQFARGSTMVRAEVMLDRWDVPNIGDRPTERLYNLELQRDLSPGFFAAARLGYIDFRPLEGTEGPDGDEVEWDRDVARYEASLGYRITRNGGLILSAFQQVQSEVADADANTVGLRLWWAF